VNLKEAIEECFAMAEEMCGCVHPDYIEPQKEWVKDVKKKVLSCIDMRKHRDSIRAKPDDYL
jgi:hypothetical protein